jgi:outer membrane protein OmpA-like peptidoglycan-associated protein
MGEGKEPEPKSGESFWAGLWRSAANTLGPALVSLVVSVGFVAFAGKAVLWARFSALDVPADQVVKAVPQDEAVAVGASILLLFGLAGLLAAVGVYLVDRSGRATPGMSRGLLAILAVEALVAIWFEGDKSVESRVIASEVALLAIAVIFWSTFVHGLINRRPGVPGRRGDRQTTERKVRAFYQEAGKGKWKSGIASFGAIVAPLVAVASGGEAFLLTLVLGASTELATTVALGAVAVGLVGAVVSHRLCFDRKTASERLEKSIEAGEQRDEAKRRNRAEEERKRAEGLLRREADLRADLASRSGSPRWREQGAERPGPLLPPEAPADKDAPARPPRASFTGWGYALAIPLTAVIVAVPSLILWEWWLAVSLATVAILGIGLWRISTFGVQRFVWYGLAVFISVPLFGTVMLMARNADDPQVQPMALIRSTDGPDEAIQGLYVTETSDRVYFANVATEGCEGGVKDNSGRLLWVPEKEVVAISIGPPQSVQTAAKSALEMSYALTPAVETGGATIDLPEDRKRAEKAREERQFGSHDTRLEHVGPAVRPNFGAGLRLDPETVSPGEEVTLRLSEPNERSGVEGFGSSREGHNLRLGGKIVDIAKEPAGSAAGAEYIETAGKRLIRLSKEGPYVEKPNGKYVLAESGEAGDGRYVKLEDPAVVKFNGGRVAEEDELYVGVERTRVATDGDIVKLRGGIFKGEPQKAETANLNGRPLLRQAWHPNHIRFLVPEDAETAVVTVECDQLAGSPLLQVTRSPKARIGVQEQQGSGRVTFSSKRSSGDSEIKSRHWKIGGLKRGSGKTISARMPPRLGAYSVSLTVTDKEGHSGTSRLKLLRLPASLFAFDEHKPKHPEALRTVGKELRRAAREAHPAKIELDGHADDPGSNAYNLNLSMKRNEEVRKQLLPRRPKKEEEQAVPVVELAYGEGCPIDPRPGRRPRNRRVDVFVVNRSVLVKPAAGCHPGRVRSNRGYLRVPSATNAVQPGRASPAGGVVAPP